MHREPGNVRRLMLLNTDWSMPGNQKQVTVNTPAVSFETVVTEQSPCIITVTDDVVIEADSRWHIEVVDRYTVNIHGTGKGEITVRTPEKKAVIAFDTGDSTAAKVRLKI